MYIVIDKEHEDAYGPFKSKEQSEGWIELNHGKGHLAGMRFVVRKLLRPRKMPAY
jgi:hypothetical protein